MAAILDMSKFSFSVEEIRAISELILEETIKGPEMSMIHTIFPGIVTGKEVGYVGEGGKVGVKNQGCNPTPQQWNINTRKTVWDPQSWEILIEQCWTDLENAATIYSLRTGMNIPDFTSTDYMNLVIEVLTRSIHEFWYRLFWFNDKAADNVTGGGIITDGVGIEYFNIINGFWQQIFAQIGVNPAQRVTIAENAGASYVAQRLDPNNVVGYLSDVVFSAPILLRNMSDTFLLVTRTVFDAYTQYLMNAHTLESARTMLLDGRSGLSFNGVPIIPMDIWDKIIRADENTGTILNNPNRILYTSRSVLAVGVDSAASFDQLRIWYNQDERTVKTEVMGRADAKLANPEFFITGI